MLARAEATNARAESARASTLHLNEGRVGEDVQFKCAIAEDNDELARAVDGDAPGAVAVALAGRCGGKGEDDWRTTRAGGFSHPAYCQFAGAVHVEGYEGRWLGLRKRALETGPYAVEGKGRDTRLMHHKGASVPSDTERCRDFRQAFRECLVVGRVCHGAVLAKAYLLKPFAERNSQMRSRYV